MKNALIKLMAPVLALLLLLPSLTFSAPKKSDMRAVVSFMDGEALVKRYRTGKFVKLEDKGILYAGDTIKTGPGCRLGFVTKGGAEIRLNENSVFKFSRAGRFSEMLDLTVGQVWTRMLHRIAKLEVRTPTAVCAVRGTETDIEQKKLLTVKVYEGHVDVTNKAGMQSLKAGQMTTVEGPKSAPAEPQQMKEDQLGTWQSDMAAIINLPTPPPPRTCWLLSSPRTLCGFSRFSNDIFPASSNVATMKKGASPKCLLIVTSSSVGKAIFCIFLLLCQ